jgi:hypothetical protein
MKRIISFKNKIKNANKTQKGARKEIIQINKISHQIC